MEYLMSWPVEYTDEFGAWWRTLGANAQDDIAAVVGVLEQRGPQLPFPYSSALSGSRHGHMRELRVQSGGEPLRIIYAFDPRRSAILLLGGNKTSDDRFYERMIPRGSALRPLSRRTPTRRFDTMTGHRPFNELTKRLSPARKARIADKTAALNTALTLHELRKARTVSQQELAARLAVGQPAVAKLERRGNMYVSNLRRYVEALGGTLEIAARFPDGAVTIATEEKMVGEKKRG
jgi:DNA-binding XRE family transcriptional regulator